jgi:hypothetical protein
VGIDDIGRLPDSLIGGHWSANDSSITSQRNRSAKSLPSGTIYSEELGVFVPITGNGEQKHIHGPAVGPILVIRQGSDQCGLLVYCY